MNHGSCPSCSEAFTGHIAIDGEHAPEVGDITVCMHCGTAQKFTEEGTRLLTNDEMMEALENNDFVKALIAVRTVLDKNT